MYIPHMPENFMALHSLIDLEPLIPPRAWCSLGGLLEQVFIHENLRLCILAAHCHIISTWQVGTAGRTHCTTALR